MNSLTFVPVVRDLASRATDDARSHVIPPIQCKFDRTPFLTLRFDADGQLLIEPCESDKSPPKKHIGDEMAPAMVYRGDSLSNASWMLVARSICVGLNGQTPALPVAAIELGDLITIGERAWMVTSLWRPAVVDAPAELRDKPCPVCGGELRFARVVQCTCGRWSHLENPEAPDDPDALNCFLKAGACGDCGRRASLEPQITPDVPVALMDVQPDADD